MTEDNGITPGAAPFRRTPVAVALLFSCVVAVIFTALQLNGALAIGKLAFPLSYDDVVYFNDALRRLDTLYAEGFWSLARDYVVVPPHSAVTTFLGVLGFSLFGPTQWAGYTANALILAGFIFLLVREFRGVPNYVAMVASVAFLSAPIFNVVVTEQRPDAMAALATAYGLFVLVTRPWSLGSKTNAVVVGLAAGFALLAKPPVFHLTLILFGFAACLKSIQERRAGVDWRSVGWAWTISVGLAILVSLPFFAFALPRTVMYVWNNTLGAQGSLWSFEMSLLESVGYYLVGAGGKLGIGGWFYLALPTLVTAVVLAVRYPPIRGTVGSFLSVFLVAYLLVTLPSNKTPFIGLAVSALILMGLVGTTAWLLRRIGERRSVLTWSVLGVLGLVALSTNSFVNIYQPRASTESEKAQAIAQWTVMDDLLDILYEPRNGGLSVGYLSTAPYSNDHAVALQARLRSLPSLKRVDIGQLYSPEKLEDVLEESDLVVAYAPDNHSVVDWLPSGDSAFRALAIDRLARDSRFHRYAEVVDPSNGDEIYVYRKTQPFEGLVSATGMNDLEGPYPQWDLPKVRWALAPEAIVRFSGVPLSKGVLRFEARSSEVTDQQMTISILGLPDATFPVGADFMAGEIPVSISESGT